MSPSRKELEASLAAKRVRITTTVERLTHDASPRLIACSVSDVKRWLLDCESLVDQIMTKCLAEERAEICDEDHAFTVSVRETLLEFEAPTTRGDGKKGKSPIIKLEVDCPTFVDNPPGNKFSFRTFLKRFEFYTSSLDDDSDKLLLLKTKLGGKAFEMVSELDIKPENYLKAINILREKFYNPADIKNKIFEEMLSSTDTIGDPSLLRNYIDRVKADLVELDNSFKGDFFVDGSVSGELVAHIVLKRIPNGMCKQLMSRARTRYPSLKTIMEVIPEILEIDMATPAWKGREIGPPKPSAILSNRRQGENANSLKNSFQSRKELKPEKPFPASNNYYRSCKLCDKTDHSARDCTTYKTFDVRLERAGALNLCTKCLGSHKEAKCPGIKGFPYACVSCGLRSHFSAMCPKSPKPFVGKTILAEHGSCIFPVIRVSLKREQRPVSFNCLVDTGSQKSFFSNAILRKLCSRENLTPNSVVMPINTFIGTKTLDLYELGVSVKIGAQKPFFHAGLFTDSLNLKFNVSQFNEVTTNIKEAGFRLCHGYESMNDTLLHGLVGLDIIQRMKKFQLISCLNGSAWETSNGIIPFGNVGCFAKGQADTLENPLDITPFENIVRSLPKCSNYLIEGALNPVSSFPDPLGPFFEDSSVERGVEKFLSLDSIGIDEKSNLSSYDEDKITKFKKTVVLRDGKYYVDLPWDDEKLSLVDSNYIPALKIMQRVAISLEKRGLYDKYTQVFHEYEELGVIEQIYVPPEEYKNYCWIPHRPVIKQGTGVTTKMRPVFNCSFKRRGGVSLNDAAYAGVNLTAQLLDLLLVFRKNNYVLLGDLKKAFLQVRLRTNKDKNRFCFFLKVNENLRAYRYNTVIFGFNASPFILSCIIKLHTERYPDDVPSSVLHNNFYVDNLVATNSDFNSLCSTYETVRERLMDAGFELQSCNSNHNHLQIKMIEDGTLVSPPPPIEKVLGYHYSPQRDSVCLAPVAIDSKVNTKRGILSQTSRIFDPLSLFLPVTVQGRILISQLWRNNLSWDQEIPENFTDAWQNLAGELNDLSGIEFPRNALVNDVPTDFLCFCDSSKLAYGFSLYAKQGSQCHLVFAKGKVAPLKKKTLPILELMAIYLAFKVVPNVLRALQPVDVRNLFVVSDAQVALSWVLNGRGTKKNLFVENRILDIKRMLEAIKNDFGILPQFKYVPSAENPADLLTRGLSSAKFRQFFDLWVHGPDWANRSAVDWPIAPLPCLNDTNKKIVSCFLSNEATSEENILPFNISKFSSLTKTIGVLEKVLRFVDKLKHRQTDTVKGAKFLLFSSMQRKEFPCELNYLREPAGKTIPPRVSALGLFLDNEGLLRATGRIQSSDIHPYQVKHPIILGKYHDLTRLVVQEAHWNCSHLGVSSTLTKLRLMGFWIPQGRQSVKGVLRHCITCKKINSLPCQTPSGSQLPAHRTNFVRPFNQVGVDFSGHFWIKGNNEDTKMYLLLFTCMSLRAVHLELLPDMSTRSFLLAFVRFTNLFGVPSYVYSDNAKTFLAAGISLSEVFISDEFKEQFRSTSIRHVTIPLYSAWHGGTWERMIQTVKRCFHKLIGRRKIEYFNFLTIVSDVEKAINDRPLTYVDSAERGLETLTPNHFLQTGYSPRLILGNMEVDDLCPDTPSRVQLLNSLQLRDEFVEKFRKIWYNEYLLSLREGDREMISQVTERISVGDVVLIKTPNKPRPFWSLGKVLNLIYGNDGKARSARILRDGCEQIHSLKHLFPLEMKDNPESSSSEFVEEGGPFFCPTCSIENDGSSPMVCCDKCNKWYHFNCVGVNEQDTTGIWFCPNCSENMLC